MFFKNGTRYKTLLKSNFGLGFFGFLFLVGCSTSQQIRPLSKQSEGIDTVLVWMPIIGIKKQAMFTARSDTSLSQLGQNVISKTITKVLAKKTDKVVLSAFEKNYQGLNPGLISALMVQLKGGDCKPSCPEVDSLLADFPTENILVFSYWRGVVRSPMRQFFSDLMGFSLMIPTFSLSKTASWNSSSDLYIAMVNGRTKNVLYFNYVKDDFDPRSMDVLEDQTEVVLQKLRI